MFYTVGIQMWPFRVLRKYRVSFHEFESESKVVLTLRDGSLLVVPGLDRKVFKIYSDYRIIKEKRELEDFRREHGMDLPPPPIIQ